MADTQPTPTTETPVTIQPSIIRQVWFIAWPVVIASMLDATEGIIDLFMVGKLGPEAISAVGMSRQIVFVVMVVMMSISTGTRTLVAQLYGAKRSDDLSKTAQQALMMGVILAVGLSLLGLVIADPALRLLGGQPDVLVHAVPFLRLYFAGVAFMVANFIIGSIFGGAGDTRTPLKISIVIICIKAISTYGFIFGAWGLPQMGVPGAALGTIFSRSVGCAMGLWILTTGRAQVRMRWNWRARLDYSIIRKMLRIGVPAGITGFFRNGARVLLYRVAAWTAQPTATIAALTIGFQVRMYAIMPALAFQVAATALVGQRLGARQITEAERFGANTIRLCMMFISSCAVLIYLFANDIVSLFTTSPEVIHIGFVMLWFFSVAQIFSALSIVVGGVLAGGGETRPPLYYTIIGQWGVMLSLSYLLAFPFNLDVFGIWIAWLAGGLTQGILTYRRYLKGKWKVTVV